jgi:hypothetical protein
MINEAISFIMSHIMLIGMSTLAAASVGSALGLYASHRRKVKNTPESYFVRGVTEEQRQALANASISFATSQVDWQTNVMFNSMYLKEVLKTLHARVACEFPLQGKKLHEVILHFVPEKDRELNRIKVRFDGKSGCPNNRVVAIVRDILMRDLKRPIVVHNVSNTADPVDDGAFHIFLHSAPSGSAHTKHPAQIWSAPNVSSAYAYNPSQQGAPFVDESTGFFVGELIGDNNLYIYADVLNNSARTHEGFFRRLWKKLKPWGPDARLGLLVRVLQQIKQDLHAEQCLKEIIARLKAEGALTESAQERQVEMRGFKGRREEVLRWLVRDILAPAANSDVVVTNCAGSTQAPVADNKFRVFFNSAPSGKPFMDVPDRFWGYRLHKRDKAFAPSAVGKPIVEDGGHVVGELVDRCLYVHQELIQYGTRAEAALVAKLLLEVRKELLAGNSIDAVVERQIFDEFMRHRQASAQSKNKGGQPELRAAQGEFHAAIRSALAAQSDLFRTEAAPNEELGREFDDICKIPKVTDVKVTKDHIVVKTSNLYCTDPRTNLVHDIGAFEIQIPVNGHDGVRWFNKTRRVMKSAMNAPHVNSEGNPCLGNMKDVFPTLIARREFASAIEAAIAFVESVNVNDSWGTHINQWPVARNANTTTDNNAAQTNNAAS